MWLNKKKILEISHFSVQVYSHAVKGTAKEVMMGQFKEIMNQKNTTDDLELLSKMYTLYRNRNAEQIAANLLLAYKKLRNECIITFLDSSY